MKILIVSDTHRSHRAYTSMINKEGEIDMLIHLGDVEGGEYYYLIVLDSRKPQ